MLQVSCGSSLLSRVNLPVASPSTAVTAVSSPRSRAPTTTLAAAVGLGVAALTRPKKKYCVTRESRGGESLEVGGTIDTESDEELSDESWGEQFQWNKAWYPMAVVEDLDAGRPTKLELLGEDLVAWKDGDGTWRVFEDRCPHRNVPLSEGRIEDDGTLLCSYHGWRFNGAGELTALPQATDKDLPRLQANPRSCASARPTQIRHGVLWVWGESSKDAHLESALVEPNIVPELEDPDMEGRASSSVWSHRDLPYGWEVAFENVTDPAHVDVAHHNIVSNRYKDPGPIEIVWERKPTNKGGFKFRINKLRKQDDAMVSTMDFRPPCQMHIKSEVPSTGASITLLINFVPTKPGWSRLVGSTLLVRGKNGETAPGFALYSAPLPRWLVHILAPAFLHQDQVFLHHQQAILQKETLKKGVSWRESYWIPTQADKGTVTLRRWLDKNGGVGWCPAASTDLSALPDKQSLFDTYSTHTEKCAVCRAALRRTVFTERLLKYSAIVVSSAGVASTSWPLLAGGAALGLGAKACGKLKKLFYEVPFNHQDNK
eukprot:TRINITY_DN37180_c0_g1_i1.p1 TRINITY_DN37180_c0_g1~~TRINITY_DN37180_c0_g1_i1.p1  ORF type:complete len:544 (-),score=69.07 TRINITY_DN37180_c0_g1_i1:276-1907(-)